VLPRIFDKFFRAPGAAAGGSGLGLTIAKGFVEAHRGVITAENRPGGGVIISLKLPRRNPASMPEYFHEPAHGKS
jgi:two-component system sensor histidine kinase KdpD